MPDIDFYKKKLRVNKHRLDDELEVQAQYQDEIADHVASLAFQAAWAKDEADRIEHRLIAEAKEDNAKLAVETAKGYARANQSWKAARSYQHECQQDLERWQGLYDAWRQRGYSLKTLADLYAAQYFSVTTVHGQSGNTVERARELVAQVRRRPVNVRS